MLTTLTDLMPLEDAAKLLRCHKETLLRAIRAGQLEAVKLGKTYRVTEQGLQRYVESLTVNTKGIN